MARRYVQRTRRPVDWVNTGCAFSLTISAVPPVPFPGGQGYAIVIACDLLNVLQEQTLGVLSTAEGIVRAMMNPTLVRSRGVMDLQASFIRSDVMFPEGTVMKIAAALTVVPVQAAAAFAVPNPAIENGDFLWYASTGGFMLTAAAMGELTLVGE